MTGPSKSIQKIIHLINAKKGSDWSDVFSMLTEQHQHHPDFFSLMLEHFCEIQNQQRTRVVDALIHVDPEQAIGFLLCLADQDIPADLKSHIAWKAEWYGDKRFSDLMCRYAELDPDPAVRVMGLMALARTQDPETLPVLQRLILTDTEEHAGNKIRLVALDVFQQIQEGLPRPLPIQQDFLIKVVHRLVKASDEAEMPLQDFKRLLGFPTREVASTLVQLFQTSSKSLEKSRTLDALMHLPAFDSVGFLVEQFWKEDQDWQWALCKRLGDFRDPRSISLLTSIVLQHENGDVRYAAVEALEKIGDVETLGVLEHVKNHDSGEDFECFPVSDRAAEAIKTILEEHPSLDLQPPLMSLLEVDWSSLTHSYGQATDTPWHLRALLGENEALHEVSWQHLWGEVFHQGDINTVTPAVVDFLLSHLEGPHLAQRETALRFLMHVGERTLGETAEEAASRSTLLSGLDRVKQIILSDAPLAVRLSAPGVLVFLHEVAEDSSLFLLQALQEEMDPDMQAALLGALFDLQQHLQRMDLAVPASFAEHVDVIHSKLWNEAPHVHMLATMLLMLMCRPDPFSFWEALNHQSREAFDQLDRLGQTERFYQHRDLMGDVQVMLWKQM